MPLEPPHSQAPVAAIERTADSIDGRAAAATRASDASGQRRMRRRDRWLFGLSGLVVALACIDSPVLLPYPLFVVCALFGCRLPRMRPWLRLLIATLLATCILETGAWAHNVIRDAAKPALFHPQLFADLLIAAGFYLGWWLTWWWRLRRDRYFIAEVFWITAIYGVLIEQQGAIFLQGLATMPLGVVLWVFVALPYGSTMALAYVLAGGADAFAPPAPPAHEGRRPSARIAKYLLPWLGLFIASVALIVVWNWPIEALDLLPPKRFPMREHPFW